MKIRKTAVALIVLGLVLVMTVNLSGCSVTASAKDLMEGIEGRMTDNPGEVTPANAESVTGFALRLFTNCAEKGKNVLVSPVSVIAALAMTANGAKGETLEQMESVLGMKSGELNAFYMAYNCLVVPADDDNKLSIANSIWIKEGDGLEVSRDFLQTNADYYRADAYKAPFDRSTLADINNWVKDKTDGMIPEILDRIGENAEMYLVNALVFDAKWATPYTKQQVEQGTFTNAGGKEQKVDFLQSAAEKMYLSDGKATGFIKLYSGGRYAFAALLPNEGLSPEDYLAGLDAKALLEMLANPEQVKVETAIPKFKTEYSNELSGILSAMGMPDAFENGKADFSGIGTIPGGDLAIGRMIHKTYVAVDENGTKAGAATAVEMNTKGIIELPENSKKVILDRPFVYMLIDTETNIPFFIGIVNEI